MKHRPDAGPAIDNDSTFMGGDDPFCDRQPQPRAVRFGGDKRIEDVGRLLPLPGPLRGGRGDRGMGGVDAPLFRAAQT